jgi:hypothetical protein
MTDLEAWLDAELDYKLKGIAERAKRQAATLSALAGGLEVTVEVTKGGDATIPKPTD